MFKKFRVFLQNENCFRITSLSYALSLLSVYELTKIKFETKKN